MKYNFDEIIERRGTDSVKWDWAKEDVLPMWVADMDFKTAPEVIQAISEKVSHGVFGYGTIPENFNQSVMDWWETHHNFTIEKEWLLPATGILPSLSAIVRTFVKPDENIILQTPVYNHFFTILENYGCHIVCNDLKYKDGNYSIDFEDLEKKASDAKTKLLLLCNPHNPVGKVWTRADLERIAEICSRNKVMVVSDEIHSDLIFNDRRHIPFVSVAQHYELESVTCGSPCKTFNFSGLPISYLISWDKNILEQTRKTLELQENSYPNPIAMEALIAAYTKGHEWMNELKEYLYQNFIFLKNFCNEHLPEIKVIPLEATYLVWLDCSALGKTSDELSKILLTEGKVWLNSGMMYGENGEGFLRINIGCPRELLTEGLERLKKALKQ
ncbi:cystathionine beta-lyase [Chryseobacterium lactis]|uniref:cysteine-S-conjugate beta-lyase n=1 Tax=Chryseobacterium lactis TaxID=1241981 RepID=A0A3G6RP04_CHRLC|nr:MalY/PatB family protein [Chryseobacterium lactis]AZA84369.1 pyridoxal phosphate-dependent aminotransferase [Chryseobacterium lactis]AZB04757.1 pyridoxal phosphate-dependent aminotransferase [Chryseobacterium lactis]PNW14487.1 cystathionine beta-lyase [Chryseobacterium lactis]